MFRFPKRSCPSLRRDENFRPLQEGSSRYGNNIAHLGGVIYVALFAMFEIRYVFMIPKKLPTLSVLGSDSGAAEFSFFLSHKDLKNDFIFRKFAETFLLYGIGNSLLVFWANRSKSKRVKEWFAPPQKNELFTLS